MKKIIAAVLIIASFTGCKKGDEDPFISLRSRQNRLVGEWNLVDGKVETKIEDFDFDYKYIASYDDNSVRYTLTFDGEELEPVSLEGYTKIEFEDGGDFVRETLYYEKEDDNPRIPNFDNGEWNFMSKSGKFKNKERVEMEFETQEFTYEGEKYSEKTGYEIEYELIELSKNNIKIEYEASYTLFGTDYIEEGELELERN